MDAIIALDSYDDIFDDFDPQAYIERNISADFLDALGNRIRKVNTKERTGITLTLPYYKRVMKDERIIKERLSEYFWNMARYWTDKESEIRNYSIGMMLAGLIIFSIGQFIIHNYAQFFDEFIVIPAWFLTFSGLDKYLVEKPKMTSKRRFYEALSGAKVSFTDEACFTDAAESRG
jgi:hypothetical protein